MNGLNISNYFGFDKNGFKLRSLGYWGLAVAIGTSSLGAQDFAPADASQELQKRAQVQELYQKQIPLMESYLQRNPTGDKAAVFQFRLGEAYFESAKFAQIEGQSSKAALYSKKAIESLEKLRRNFAYYERMDEALLVLATTYLEMGQEDKAGPVLSDIADRFPNSPIMEQASYLLGDYYVRMGRFTQAKIYYEKATTTSRWKAYGHYKLAWVALQQSQPGLALKEFEKVLRINTTQGESAFDYSKDAAREMVWPAVEVYRSSGVIAYLEKTLTQADLLETALTSFAMGLNTKGEYALASQVFEYLINRFQSNPQREEWMTGQLQAEEKLGRSSKIVQLVSRLSGDSANSEKLKSQIFSSAKKLHALAQTEKDSTKKAQQLDQAIAYYEAYDRFQLEDAKSAETSFYFGEALFSRGRYDDAIQAYKKSAMSSKTHDKKQDAAWNWYLTAEKQATGFKYNGKEFKQASAKDEEFLEAASFVARLEGFDQEKRITASYQSARLLYQLNDFERSLPIFESLAKNFSTSKEGKLSAQLVLDIYSLRKDYDKVANYAREFRADSDSSTRAELSVIEQKAEFKKIQDAEAQARATPEASQPSALKDVASSYLGFARNYPQSSFVDSSIWASVQLFASAASMMNDKEFSELRASFELLTKKYSASKYVSEAVSLMGDFLAYQKPDVQILQAYRAYRSNWYQLMNKQPASKRGPYAMLVYELSTAQQQKNMHADFLKLPVNSDNRKPIAIARMEQIQLAQKSFERISLSNIKTLQKNTKAKIESLDALEKQITDFVKLGEPELAVQSIGLLAESYSNMAASLRSAPVPAILEGDNLSQYKAAVEDKAASYDLKAEQAKGFSRKTARELGVAS